MLDTNLVLSALVFGGGKPGALRLAWQDGRILPLIATPTADELLRALGYPKFRLSAAEQDRAAGRLSALRARRSTIPAPAPRHTGLPRPLRPTLPGAGPRRPGPIPRHRRRGPAGPERRAQPADRQPPHNSWTAIRPTSMSNVTHDIVAKLWNLCNVLKDDGVTYHQYVTELTYLLFLKMAQETGTEDQLPPDYRWADLEARAAPDRLEFYKILLIHLGTHGSRLVQEIFANASSFIRKPATLSTLVAEIDKLDWYSARQEGLGDLYEGLLQKNANEKKSGAGQYFTPRPLIDSMVAVMKPTLADTIQDPAAGTGGFLIAANHYLRAQADPDGWTEAQQRKYRRTTFYGMEHVQDTHRLALMNLMLHGIDSDPGRIGPAASATATP